MGGTQPSFPIVTLKKEHLVVVTGGNTGIGYETAKWIAMMGARVIIACRSEERARAAIENMQIEFKEEKTKTTAGLCTYDTLSVEFMALDLASMKSVQTFINDFTAKESHLNLLICNAGIAICGQAYTEDDFESMFQVNYLGHFLIVTKLLPMMLKSGSDCRVVMVTSDSHEVAKFDLENAQGRQHTKESFPRHEYYGNTKLYQIMQMFSLNRKLRNTDVSVISVHPGLVDTEVTRGFSDFLFWNMYFKVYKWLGLSKTPFEGATTVINAAVNPKYHRSRDCYFVDLKETEPSNDANADVSSPNM
ncbi:dehydrogenase/reductase SDR family member on chromosome X-like isoform X2 [Ostrea edulis]|uniref:dehydrogenase/reductase SDR family member on chromosome X-like isoform X2 n=1 Tax=Ostrea edulis TaxID=37623 RepID=UPI0024AFF755|nr:dehydrogenase/reductase SDR family member on chromosome X-like isoform X2 [Ostrea edulis]